MKSNKNKFTFGKLFRNNKFILVLSVIVAVCIWINLSLSDTNESTATVSNIPVQVNLSDEALDNGLQIFSGNDQNASVTVTGNRVTLGSVTADDIIISAPTAGTITTSGTYPLSLTSKKANASDNFEITSSVSPSVITIFVDHFKEASFDVEPKLTYKVSEGYHADVTLSSDSITVSGPQTEISKISYVSIEGEIKGELKEDTTLDCEVKLYDNSGSELTNNMLTLSETTVTAAFSVMSEKEIPLSVSWDNKPSGLNVDKYISISPAKILVTAPKDVLDKLESIPTEKVDFTSLTNKKTTLDLDIELPAKCFNLSEIERVTATVDLSSFKSKRISAKQFNVTGLGVGYSYSVSTESIDVQIVGPSKQLSAVTSSDIICNISTAGLDGTTGSISLPVKVGIKGNDACWAYGTYKANVYVTKD